KRNGVIGVVDGVGGAMRIGQVGRARSDGDEWLFLFFGNGCHGQRGGRVGAAYEHIEVLLVEPFACPCRGDVGLVLVVGDHELDLLTVDFATRVFNGHAHGFAAAGAIDIGIDAGHIGDHADADDIVGNAGSLAG